MLSKTIRVDVETLDIIRQEADATDRSITSYLRFIFRRIRIERKNGGKDYKNWGSE